MTTISYPTLIPRPKEYVSGVWSWLTTVDHKKIGTMYGVIAVSYTHLTLPTSG